jgi:uncharacterized protein (DUF427 family)
MIHLGCTTKYTNKAAWHYRSDHQEDTRSNRVVNHIHYHLINLNVIIRGTVSNNETFLDGLKNTDNAAWHYRSDLDKVSWLKRMVIPIHYPFIHYK